MDASRKIIHHLLPVVVMTVLWSPEHVSALDTFDHTHARYAGVLSNFVSNGRVDYARLQAAPQELDAYLNELAAVNPGAAWRRLSVRFGGQVMSLDHLENKIIRVDYHEPRIHFALVCAARGCPPLRSEPYVGRRLASQLDDQAKQFLAAAGKNRFDAAKDTLWLSPIFKWYKEDFVASAGSVSAYIKPYLPEELRQALGRSSNPKIRYTNYDWGLNDWSR